jgi:hypothetical protein
VTFFILGFRLFFPAVNKQERLGKTVTSTCHERFESTSDPSLNGHLHYPNDTDRSLNESTTDKTREYRADYNNNPSNPISFMTVNPSTNGKLHSEFVLFLFLQTDRETDCFLTSSGSGLFHLHRVTFSSVRSDLNQPTHHSRRGYTLGHFLPETQGQPSPSEELSPHQ